MKDALKIELKKQEYKDAYYYLTNKQYKDHKYRIVNKKTNLFKEKLWLIHVPAAAVIHEQ